MRMQFRKGLQRKFLNEVLYKLGCPSLRELGKRGIDVPYSTLKNYYSETRLIPESLYKELHLLANLDVTNLKFKLLDEHWGQRKGGKE